MRYVSDLSASHRTQPVTASHFRRVFSRLRTVLALGLLVAVCGDPIGPGGVTARLSFATTTSSEAIVAMQTAGLSIDNARIIIRRSDETIVLDTVIVFPAGVNEIELAATVPVEGASEMFAATIQLRSGTNVLFEGTQTVEAKRGATLTPAEINTTFVGPGANAARIDLTPPTSALTPGGTAQLTATAFDGQDQPIPNALIDWSTSAANIATVSATGLVTAGNTGGTATITAKIPDGVSSNAHTVTVTVPASQLVVISGGGQTGMVSTALAQPFVVEARGTGGVPVAGVSVSFAGLSANSSVAPASATTDGQGRASTTMTLGTVAGAQGFQASASGMSPVSVTATATVGTGRAVTVVSGDAQSALVSTQLSSPLVVRVADQFNNPVPGATVTWARVSGGGSVGATTTTTAANGQTQTTYTVGAVAGGESITATVGTSSVTFTATATPAASPTITLALTGGRTFVGVTFTVQLQVTLGQPAPAGGLLVSFGTSDQTRLDIAAPEQVTIPAGQTQGVIDVQGIAAGAATVTATATGYTQGTLLIPVSLRLINVPPAVNVAFGATASVPIQLAEPAPVGGVTVNVVSSAPSIVTVQTAQVNFPVGATLANATVTGTLPGPATVTVTATDYISGASTVTSQANLNIVETSVALNASFGNTFTVRLQSAGSSIAAPAGGLQVNLVATDPTCVSVPTSVTIPAGLTQVVASATYGGGATLPCSTQVTASATNIASDNVTLNVAPIPTITLSSSPVGSGLQRGQSIGLSSSSPTGATVHLVSSDPSAVLLSLSTTTPGSASIDVPLGPGVASATYYVQSLGPTGSVTITPSAPLMNGVAATQTIVTAWLDVVGMPGSFTTLAPDATFTVRLGIGNTGALSELQAVRAGGPPLDVTVTVANPAVFEVLTSAGPGATGTAQILAQQFSTPGSVATGGFAIRPVGVGATTLTATSAGASSTSNATQGTTVTAPGMTMSNSTVGAGLQRSQSISLGASNHGGVTVRITSADPARLLVSPDANTVGSAFIDIPVLNGTSFIGYVAQGIEGATGSVTVDATSPLFTPVSASIPLAPAEIDLVGVPSSVNIFASDNVITARIGIGSPSALSELQAVRAGSAGFDIDVVSSAPAIVGLVTTAGVSGNATVHIPALAFSSPGSVAAGGVATTPVAVGASSISATGTGLIATTNATQPMAVTAATMSLSTSTVGSGMMRGGSGSLSGGDHGGVVIRLTSADPAKLLLSLNTTTAGTAFIDVPIANGVTFFGFVTHGVEGQTGNITVTATSPLFTNSTSSANVVQPALDIVGLPGSATTLSTDNVFQVRIGIGSASALSELQALRFGGSTAVATIQSSTVSGQLVTSLGVGATANASIAPQQFSTPGSVATGGVAFRPFSAGSTVVSATIPGFIATTNASATVNITSPTISMSATTVGGGLMRSGSGSLSDANHGGVTVRVTSSNPSVALVALNATTAAAPFIDIPLTNGTSFFSYVVHGLEGANATVQLTAVASGFTDGTTTATVVPPAFDLSGISPTRNTASTQDPFSVRIGIGSASALSELQALRFGATPLTVTVTTTNASVVPLITTAGSSASTQLTIAAGAFSTPGTVATGGVALDGLVPGTATISGAIPGYIATSNATHLVTVSQASFTVSSQTVGAGLQRGGSVSLSGSDHGGVTVRVTSADPSRVLISPNATTPGSAFIDVVLPNGSSFFSFVASGLEGVTGDVQVTATTTGFVTSSGVASVVQPAADIIGLPSTASIAGGDDVFTIRLGVPNGVNTALQELQAVRAGAPAVTATVASSNAALAALVTTPLTAGSVSVSIPAQASSSGGTVAAGGVALRPLTVGPVTVSVTIAGYRVLPTSSVAVTIGN